jgi:hypothetical protein
VIDRHGGYALGEASVKGDSRSWKKDGIARTSAVARSPSLRSGWRGGRRRPPLHILSVFFYAGVMACVTVGLFSWFLQPFLDGVFAELHP